VFALWRSCRSIFGSDVEVDGICWSRYFGLWKSRTSMLVSRTKALSATACDRSRRICTFVRSSLMASSWKSMRYSSGLKFVGSP